MKMWKMPLQEAEVSRQLQVDEEPLNPLLHGLGEGTGGTSTLKWNAK